MNVILEVTFTELNIVYLKLKGTESQISKMKVINNTFFKSRDSFYYFVRYMCV